MSEAKIIIAPADDRRVRFPDGKPLDDAVEVTLDTYWRRRLADGDVVEFEPETKKGK